MITNYLVFLWLGLLLLLDGLIAATQSAFINSHPSHLQQMEEDGQRGAALAVRIANESTNLIVSLKAGRTIFRLIILGLVLIEIAGQDFWGSLSNVTAWLIVFAAGLVMGIVELISENIVLRTPEKNSLRLSVLAAGFQTLFLPFGKLSLRISDIIAGSENNHGHSLVTEEEIMTMVDAGEEGGVIEEDEKAMIYSIFQLGDTLVREIMIPRIDMLAFEESTLLMRATEQFLETGYSRAPVYRSSIDNIIGLVYSKDLLAAWQDHKENETVASLLREAYFVPEAKKADDLLAELQAKRIHMAVVVDEYGGTAGVATLEDIVEEIVGEIRDEYDDAEEIPFQIVTEGEFVFTGGIDLDDVNKITGAPLPKDTSETLGGFIYSRLGKVPVIGEKVEACGLELIVEQVSGRRIRKIRARRIEGFTEETSTNGN